jgi:CheY-like chemotaxis protein
MVRFFSPDFAAIYRKPMDKIPSGLNTRLHDAIEVKLWDTYLAKSRNNLASTLSAYSLETSPVNQQADNYKISFQFMLSDWEQTIQRLLSNNYIPYEVIRVFKTDIYRQRTRTIYVAEDDLNILFALNTMLEDAGYEIIMSHCGKPVLNPNLPATDLFILDNRMPDVDGIDVCRHLKTQSTTAHVPVIMISAFRSLNTQAKKAGADHFLEKPFEMKQLLELVAKCTKKNIKDRYA